MRRASVLPGIVSVSAFLSAFLSGSALADLPLHPYDGLLLPSVHGEALAQHRDWKPAPALEKVPTRTAAATPGPDSVVYGYWPYWGDDLSTVNYDDISHLALFATAMSTDGTITNTGYWTNNAARALSLAQPYGVKVHMTVAVVDSSILTSVLGSSSARSKAISQIKSLVTSYGGHGVNIDFEGVPAAQRDNFVTFVKDLRAATPGLDLWLAMPAVDWSGAYDYDVLANTSDGLFIMGYGYHYSGGNPGPVAPLYGESPWSNYALDWTIADYLAYGAPAAKIVVGLPLYGYNWPTTNNTVPGSSTSKATSQTYVQAVAAAGQYGRQWDSITHTPYTFPSATSQLWYDDAISIGDKVAYSVDQGLAGVGFWALTYEDADPGLWSTVRDLTTLTCEDYDSDQDGFNACIDCDDANAAVNPGTEEIPRDGIDNNCDGSIDETSSGCGTLSSSKHIPFAAGLPLAGLLGLWWMRRKR